MPDDSKQKRRSALLYAPHVALDNIQKAIPDAFKVVHLDRVLPIRR